MKKVKSQVRRSLTTVLVLLVALLLNTRQLEADETQNVFIVVIDGLRNLEGFEDPTHQYIPRIWNDLRPQGTIYTEFYNDYLTTYTTPAHLAMLSGQWQMQSNLLNEVRFNDVRSDEPTLFEYYRYATGAPQDACWIVTGKQNNLQADWGLEPTFGPTYKANVVLGGTDTETFNTLADVLDENHPKLVLVNFRDVDETAHSGVWGSYTTAIYMADTLVSRVWNDLIQGDPVYRDRTTMLLVSDHGRHLPEFGDFQNHGGICHGCRHIPFLAIGPDTPAGREVNDRHYLIDIAPTVGELLGFPAPFARGRTLVGIFKDELSPDPRLHVYAQNPKVALYNQTVFVVWSENDETETGTQRVYFKKKHFNDNDFGAPVLLSNTAVRWAFAPAVAANRDGLHVVWLDGRSLDARGDTWSVFYRRSPDYGTTWEPEKMIVTSTFESSTTRGEIIGEPELLANTLGEIVLTVRYTVPFRHLTSFRSTDAGRTWNEVNIQESNDLPRQYMATNLSQPKEVGLTWIDMAQTPDQPAGNDNWEIFFKRSLNSGVTWRDFRRVTNDGGYSYTPLLAYGSKLLVVWANRDISGDSWKLLARISNDKGTTWGNSFPMSTGTGSAWQPALVYDTGAKTFYLVFVDSNAPRASDLRLSTSKNGTSWTSPVEATTVPSNGAIRRKPSIAFRDGHKYLAWEEEEPSTGNWKVQVLPLDF